MVPEILSCGIVYENGIKVTPTIQSDIFDTSNTSNHLAIAGFALVRIRCAIETTNAGPPSPSLVSDSTENFSCVYPPITRMYAFWVRRRKARKCYPCRCLDGKKISSSGRAGAMEVKWNRRRSYLVSSNFFFLFWIWFCLVLILLQWYAKIIVGGCSDVSYNVVR